MLRKGRALQSCGPEGCTRFSKALCSSGSCKDLRSELDALFPIERSDQGSAVYFLQGFAPKGISLC